MDHLFYMSMALDLAQKAWAEDEVPVGAVIVKNQKVVSKAYNKKEQNQCVLSHAEVIAIEQASCKFKSWRLDGSSIYITLEPCLMCVGAIVSSRIDHVIYACKDPKLGAAKFFENKNLNHKVQVTQGVMEDSCSKILTDFFKKKRS